MRTDNILCVGNYNNTLKDKMNYPSEFYDDTDEGTIVVVTMLNCSSTGQSAELAIALGLEAWDFNTHRLEDDKIQWDELYRMGESGGFEWDEHGVKNLKILMDYGFLCIYQPNG